MDLLGGDLEKYVDEHTTPETDVLQELNRETNLKVLMPQMLSGHLQGQTLKMFSHMLRPKQILEVGTYTGYSAICMAAGLQEGGTLHTIDKNEELEDMVRKFWARAGMDDKIKLYLGDANEIIPNINETFDLVFIDADKVNYSNYYDLVIDKVRPDGFIIADNVLWSGKVIEPNPDIDTEAIKAFNEKIQNDNRVDNVLLPVRDGLMIIHKLNE